jgi:hypothetical protein
MGDALFDRPRVWAFETHQRSLPPRPSNGRITKSKAIVENVVLLGLLKRRTP